MNNARALFERLRDGGAAEIEKLIAEREPESVLLDFKEKTHPDGKGKLSESDRKNYSKALSGFANAQGGVLVWGVKEKRADERLVAWEAKPISNLPDFVAQLNGDLPNAVIRAVDGVENVGVSKPGVEGEGFVLSYVPESPYAPHRAELSSGKRYYRRTGESFMPLEHYELEDMFGRRQRPKLVPIIIRCKSPANRRDGQDLYWFQLSLRNEGRALAQFVGIDLEFPTNLIHPATWEFFSRSGVRHWPGEGAKRDFTHIQYRSRRDDPPIFPKEEAAIWANLQRAGQFGFTVNDGLFAHHQDRGTRFRVVVYADSCPSEEHFFSWMDLHNF